jgi:16S rRNA (guanine966-N2)-methyltransferase
MGFEMLSRGASGVDFIERDRARADLIKKNALELGIADFCHIINRDVRSFLKSISKSYDIIYYDPPYDSNELKSIDALLDKLTDNGILLYEYRKLRKGDKDSEIAPKELLCDSRTFGDTVVDFYCKPTDQ